MTSNYVNWTDRADKARAASEERKAQMRRDRAFAARYPNVDREMAERLVSRLTGTPSVS